MSTVIPARPRLRTRLAAPAAAAVLGAASLAAPGLAASAASAPTVHLVVAGDIGCASGCTQAATADLVAARGPAAVATLGDAANTSGSAGDYGTGFRGSWGRFASIIRPVPGDHDYVTPAAGGYFDYFGAAAGTRGQGYYSYDLGSWHVVALNSEISTTGAQLSWLKADLAAHPVSCVAAYWHRDRFSSGAHGSNTSVAPLFQALYDAGADLVVTGHDHDYERFAPMSPSGAVDTARGLRQFVVGTGGQALKPFRKAKPGSQLRRNSSHGVLDLALKAGGYDWTFVKSDGATTDSGSATCSPAGGAAAPTTPAPTTPAPTPPAATTPAPTSPAPTTPTPTPPAPTPPAPTTPTGSSTDGWYGWDPASAAVPPRMPVWPFSTNTGLWQASRRSGLVTVNNFTTSRDGQVVSGLRLTGTITVQNSGVTFVHDAIEGRIVNERFGSSASAGNPNVIYCDVYQPGPQSTDSSGLNSNKGTVNFYRSNIWGQNDAVRAYNGTVMQDNFVHDLSVGYDGYQAGPSHNDALQIEGQSTAYTGIKMIHNTVFGWGVDNYAPDGVRQVATRDGGPNWTNTGNPVTSTGKITAGGAASATARKDGYINAGVMVGNGAGHQILISGNMFRGPAGWMINATPGNHIAMSDNVFASNEGTSDRRPKVVTNLGNLEVNSHNVYFPGDPRAGSAIG